MPTAVGGGFYWALRGACRAAAQLRLAQIGADTVLVSLLNAYPGFRGVLGPSWDGKVSPAPGGGHDDRRIDLPPEAELELSRTTREVLWRDFGWRSAGGPATTPEWATEVHVALRLAMAIAVARGAPWVGGDHLLEALLAEPSNSASRYLRQRGVDLELLTDVAQRTWPAAGGEPPPRALADSLHRIGVLVDPGRGGEHRSTALTRRVATSAVRMLTQAGPALTFVEDEAVAETVRLGHDRTTVTHLILAILVLEEEMAASGLRPASDYAQACDFVLRPFTLDREMLAMTVASIAQEGAIAPPQRRRSWRSSPKNPPWTVAAVRVAEAARGLVPSDRKALVGSAHLLYAVLADSDDSGRRLLREHSVDPATVQDLLVRRLGIQGGSSGMTL